MFAIIYLLATFIADLFKPPRRLEVENLFLRHQLNIALRRAPQRVRLRAGDRAVMVWIPEGGRACSVCPASFGLTRPCGGIEQDFGLIGAGNLAVDQGGPELAVSCANSSSG